MLRLCWKRMVMLDGWCGAPARQSKRIWRRQVDLEQESCEVWRVMISRWNVHERGQYFYFCGRAKLQLFLLLPDISNAAASVARWHSTARYQQLKHQYLITFDAVICFMSVYRRFCSCAQLIAFKIAIYVLILVQAREPLQGACHRVMRSNIHTERMYNAMALVGKTTVKSISSHLCSI